MINQRNETSRAWLRTLVKAVAWSGGLVFALLLVLALLPDSKGGGDENLIMTAVSPVPEGKNSHPELAKLAAALRLNPDEEKRVRLCADDAACKPEALAAVFARNAEPLRRFDAFRGKRFLAPEWADVAKLDYATPIPKFSPLFLAAALSTAQARLLLRQGRKVEALERLVRMTEVGSALEAEPSSMITYMVGLNLRMRALTALREVLAGKPALPDAARKDALARLGDANAGRAGLKHALRMEYTLNANMIARMNAKEFNTLGEDSWIVNHLAGLYFKRNRTREMLRQDFARVLARVDAPCGSAPEPEPPARLWTHPQMRRGNLIGVILHQMSRPNFEKLLERRCAEAALTQATSLSLAAK